MNKWMMMALLAALASAASGNPGGKMTVTSSLDVATKAGKVLVTVRVENHTDKPVYVPRSVYEDDELFRREFDVRDSAGAEVPYIGPMVKRGPFTRDDYLAVKPGAKVSNTIDITRSYDFRKGMHTYTVSYGGGPVADLARLDNPVPAARPVGPVPLTFTGK